MQSRFLSDGYYAVYALSVYPEQELRRSFVASYALAGGVFFLLEDRAGWLRSLPSRAVLDAQGEHRLRVLCCHSMYVEVERMEVSGVSVPVVEGEATIGSAEVWVGQSLFLASSPQESRKWLRFVASRWWRFGGLGTPVLMYDAKGRLRLRTTLGELLDILAQLGDLDTGGKP